MTRLGALLIASCIVTAACGDDNPSGPSTATAPAVFTARLSPANEVPAVTNAESSASGVAQISISGSTATMYFQLSGLAAGTNLVGAHIHPGAAGTNGPVIVNTGLTAGAPLTMPSGDVVEFTARDVPVDAATAQAILNNPAGFYFNVHTPLNPGGVARGQLTRIQ